MGQTFSAILKDIRAKKFAPVYVLDGEEPFFIDKICDAIEQHALTDADRDFNQTIFYGKDAAWDDVVNACRRFPMFAERQLVILREAQAMRSLEQLSVYWENPSNTTIFVIAYKNGKIDKRKKVFKKLLEESVAFTSDPIKDEKLPEWIIDLGKQLGLQMTMSVAVLLANTLGSKLTKIENELNKVKLNKTEGDTELTEAEVEKYIGISAVYAPFKLPDAILNKDKTKVYRMLNYFMANPKEAPPQMVGVHFYNAYSRILAVQSMQGKTPAQMATELKVNPYSISISLSHARKMPREQVEQALLHIAHYMKQSQGFDTTGNYGTYLAELVGKLMSN